MQKKILLLALLMGLFVVSTSAQITVPSTLVAGHTIKVSELNTNFSTIANHALDRLSGGNLAGNVTADSGITIDGIDIGSTVCPTCAPTFKDLTLVTPATGLTVAGVNIVNLNGKIPALTTTYFAALAFDAANLTGTFPVMSGANFNNLNAGNLASGTVPDARFPATLPAASGANLTALTAANISGGTFGAVSAANLTSIPAGNLTGSIADARLSANVPLINVANSFATAQIVAGRSDSTGPSLAISSGAFGTGVAGAAIIIGRNSSGSGAPSVLQFTDRTAAANPVIWIDTTGVVRTNATPPVENGSNSDVTTGTVVGLQASFLASKDLLGDDLLPDEALATIMRTPIKHFQYKNGAFRDSVFHGIITDWSPEFSMDSGKAFNPASAFGYTVQSIKALQSEIDELRAEIAALKAERIR